MTLPAEKYQGLNAAVMEAGKEALSLIQRFLSGRVSRRDLLAGLGEITGGLDGVMTQNWDQLTSDAAFVPHWQVLQALKGIVEELEYQLGEYGESTLYDDMKDLALNLKRIAGGLK
ncbi:MAG: hypothetical protein K6T29_05130 [Peptococcaceae bacterium]|nr:hypothetical protein [Peptococcaceae bacterium]